MGQCVGEGEEGERRPSSPVPEERLRAAPAGPRPALGHPLEGAPEGRPDEVSRRPGRPGRGHLLRSGPPGRTLFWARGAGARACNQLVLGSRWSWSLPRAVIIRSCHKLP